MNSFNSLKVTILGSNGFLGKNIDLYLKEKNLNIIEVTKTKNFDVNCFLNKEYFNYLEKKIIGTDVLIHLACFSNPFLSNKTPNLELANINFTFKLLEICNKLNIKNIIFPSSGGVVYGDSDTIHKESEPASPTCLYGKGKLSCENLLRIYSQTSNSNTTILRLSNVFGKDQICRNYQGVIPYIINSIILDKKITLFGNTVRDFIFINDVARAFYLALNNNRGFDLLNISSGKGTSILELCEMIAKLLGKKFDFELKSRREFDIQTNILNNDKANNVLGWKPTHTIESALIEILSNSSYES